MDISKLRKLRKSFMAVLHVTRLRMSMRRLSLYPVATGGEPESDEISTGPRRKEHENLHPSQYESRNLKLKFSNNINGPRFTGRPVGGDLGSTLNLDLVDCRTEDIIKCGPEASAKVEIIALEKEELRIATSWPGEKSRIRGDPHVTLKDGRVSVSHISFKHTKVAMRKSQLRLGARVVYPYDIGTRIMEAVTEPFFVMDRRSMPKSKRPLNLDDQVWKLQTIGKGGPYHDRLMKGSIKTVREFLRQYFLNRENLLKILGRRMRVKKLNAAVNKAKSKLDLKRYVYPSAPSRENRLVVFTDVGELIGIYQEGQFVSVDKFTGSQKAYAMERVKTAFQDRQNLKVLDDDDDTSKMFCPSNSSNAVCPLEAATLDGSNGFSFEAYYPTDTQQQPVPNATIMPSTSLLDNYHDSINQINSSATLTSQVPDLLDPYDNDFIYQPLPENFWN
ncbi:calmodulin-binding protein 60 C-like [Lycium ferocissimum]|uniref:calmodulin-binding protein 60 C-like n=1 Tax=Lycium ferocissimum TaxID=112874 RepID=UPI0028151E9B|nr:calmodulin-binding protein 60 C-like [Lycium ferocissimum]